MAWRNSEGRGGFGSFYVPPLMSALYATLFNSLSCSNSKENLWQPRNLSGRTKYNFAQKDGGG